MERTTGEIGEKMTETSNVLFFSQVFMELFEDFSGIKLRTINRWNEKGSKKISILQ